MAVKKSAPKSHAVSKKGARPASASKAQKSRLLCSIGLFLLVAAAVLAIFEVPNVRPNIQPEFVFGMGVICCLICAVMGGYMSREDVAEFGTFIKNLLPTLRSAP